MVGLEVGVVCLVVDVEVLAHEVGCGSVWVVLWDCSDLGCFALFGGGAALCGGGARASWGDISNLARL